MCMAGKPLEFNSKFFVVGHVVHRVMMLYLTLWLTVRSSTYCVRCSIGHSAVEETERKTEQCMPHRPMCQSRTCSMQFVMSKNTVALSPP